MRSQKPYGDPYITIVYAPSHFSHKPSFNFFFELCLGSTSFSTLDFSVLAKSILAIKVRARQRPAWSWNEVLEYRAGRTMPRSYDVPYANPCGHNLILASTCRQRS